VTASWCCVEGGAEHSFANQSFASWIFSHRVFEGSAVCEGEFLRMRLTREKVVRLSHQITDVLVSSDEVEFIEDRDTIRQQVVQILTATLKEEEKADAEVRKRITSQKKEILEGSEEWDVLYRKYYADELRRMGIAAAPDDRRERRS
jgi:uncharacterized protein DUF507